MGKELNKDYPKFEGMMRILSLLSEVKWTTAAELSDKLGVGKRTIIRYINDINTPFEEGGGLGLIDRSNKGYKLIDTNFLDTLKGLNDYYTIAAIQTTPFGEGLNTKPVFNKDIAQKLLPRLDKPYFRFDKKHELLLKAFVNNNIIEIEYSKEKGVNKKHILIPLRLISSANVYYLSGYEMDNKLIQHFLLNKIESISINSVFTDRAFIKEKLDFLNSRWGFMANDKVSYNADITFETEDSIAESLIRSPLHSSQKHELYNGKYRFFISVHNAQEFVRWTYKYGTKLKIVSPNGVIDIIRKEAKRYLAIYKEEKE